MMTMLQNTPLYVFAILIVLLWAGFKQTKDRNISLLQVFIAPIILAVLSFLAGNIGTDFAVVTIVSWLLGFIVAFVIGYFVAGPKDASYDTEKSLFLIKGSYVPLTLFMGIFITNYVIGALTAMGNMTVQGDMFLCVIAAVYGVFSAIFLSRAVTIASEKSSDEEQDPV